uniref:Uncharacterized protein n=1 Tax=Tetradesmus obliquus TaxID=3088 RepID=A0A383W1M9_TETOB|eukprot:jgi/Sobl393_1/18520/SZX70944.1
MAGLFSQSLQAGHLHIFNFLVDLPQASVVSLDEFNLYDGVHTLKLLQLNVKAGASDEVIGICAVITAEGISISSEAMQQLLLDALSQLDARRITAAAAQQLFQLRDAQAAAAGAVAELLTACVERGSVSGVQLVGQLPAAAQIDQQSAEQLLQAALQKQSGGSANALLCSVLQLPVVQRLEGSALVRLLTAGIESVLPLELLQLLYDKLPAARQGALDAAAVRQLLLLSFEEQEWDVFEWLWQLPAAPLDDQQVAACCEVRCWMALA